MNILNVVGSITPPPEFGYDETRVNIIFSVLIVLICILIVLLIRFILAYRKQKRQNDYLQENVSEIEDKLSADEKQLLLDYRKLDDVGKLSVKETIITQQKLQLQSDIKSTNDAT